jgi:protein SCO1/2
MNVIRSPTAGPRMKISNRFAVPMSCALAGLLAAGAVSAGDASPPADPAAAAHQDHGAGRGLHRSEVNYVIPAVALLRDDGKHVALPAELDDGRPVALNFIYTSCTTICPLSSQVFAQFQDQLGDKRSRFHLVSISIDPEQDTPARLREYAQQYGAKPGWDHYTGAFAVIGDVQRAFNAYRGDKMSHTPLTLLREAPGKPWVRIDGFASVDDLLAASRSWADRAALVSR